MHDFSSDTDQIRLQRDAKTEPNTDLQATKAVPYGSPQNKAIDAYRRAGATAPSAVPSEESPSAAERPVETAPVDGDGFEHSAGTVADPVVRDEAEQPRHNVETSGWSGSGSLKKTARPASRQPVWQGAKARPPESRPSHRPFDPWEEKRQRAPKIPPASELISSMRMHRHVYEAIRNTIGRHPAEQGGMLLSATGDYTITDYVYDASAATTGAAYNPNTDFLNRALIGRENQFCGIVHSHPPGFRRLSGQDERAAWSNLTSPHNPQLRAYLMPLVMTIPDTGRFELLPFIVTCHPHGNGEVKVRSVDLEILE
ncbi:Mov34/MPN/PAD-1 family protein [Azospirillum humicireducens]|nr:Mov34/MPN/PAD-1 family protein [Azospirillum humicireducens]